MSQSTTPPTSILKSTTIWKVYPFQNPPPQARKTSAPIDMSHIRSSLDLQRSLFNNQPHSRKVYIIPHEPEDDEDGENDGFKTIFDVSKLTGLWEFCYKEDRAEKKGIEKIVGKLMKPLHILAAKVEDCKAFEFSRMRG